MQEKKNWMFLFCIIFYLVLMACTDPVIPTDTKPSGDATTDTNDVTSSLTEIPSSWNASYSIGEDNTQIAIIVKEGKIYEADGVTQIFPYVNLANDTVYYYSENECSIASKDKTIIAKYTYDSSTGNINNTQLSIVFKKIPQDSTVTHQIKNQLQENIWLSDVFTSSTQYYSLDVTNDMTYQIELENGYSDVKISVYKDNTFTSDNSYFENVTGAYIKSSNILCKTGSGKIYLKVYSLSLNKAFKLKYYVDTPIIQLEDDKGVINIDATSDFEPVNFNEELKKDFTIKNKGTKTLEISDISFIDVDANLYSIYQQPTKSISPNSESTFKVKFLSTSKGIKKSKLIIKSNDEYNPSFSFNVCTEVFGIPDISIYDNSSDSTNKSLVDFGSTGIKEPLIINLTVKNSGDGVLKILSNKIYGTDESCFTVEDISKKIIMPGTTSTVTIKFFPDKLGEKTAYINFSNNVLTNQNYGIDLTGKCIDGTGGLTWEF